MKNNFVAKHGLKINRHSIHKDKKHNSKSIRGNKHKQEEE